MRHVAVLFHRLGPYHHARLRALSRVCEVTALELSAVDDTYAWARVNGDASFRRVTLFQERDADQERGHDVRERVHAALDEARPEVVAVPGWSSRGALAALRWCCRTRTPAVLLSESTAADERRVWWKELVKRRIVRLCQAALVGGSLQRDYVVRLGMPPARVFLGYDVVDNDHFHLGAAAARDRAAELRQRLELPERYFLASSRFVPKKNLPALLRAYTHYRKLAGARAWDLVVVGDGEFRSELLRLRENLGLREHVLLPGFKQYEELPVYYGLASAFVHASTVEQWGLVVNEAMAARLPVLVSNRCGCAPDLVEEGVNGFTFDPSNERELARLLGRLSASACDLASLGDASGRKIGRWTPYHFAKGVACACDVAVRSDREKPGLTDRILLRSLTGGVAQ